MSVLKSQVYFTLSFLRFARLCSILFSILILNSCGGGEGSTATNTSSNSTETIQNIETTETLISNGVAQKGPFIIDSEVSISRLDSFAIETGERLNTVVDKPSGGFSFAREIDQESQFSVSMSDRFAVKPTITTPNQEATLLFALVVTDEHQLTDISLVKVIVKEPPLLNESPIVENVVVFTKDDVPLDISLSAEDSEGDPLKIILLSQSSFFIPYAEVQRKV